MNLMSGRDPNSPPGAPDDRFATLAELAPVGIFQTDADGNCLFVNKRWCEFAGLSPEQAAGRGWATALHPEDRERVFERWYAAARGGTEFREEYRFRTPEGRVRWLQGSAVAIRGAGGATTGHLGTVTDVTERKLAEEERRAAAETLRASEERFRFTARAAGITLFQQDAELRYTWIANPVAGYTTERVVGRREEEVEHLVDDLPALVRAKREVLATGRGTRIEVRTTVPGVGREVHEVTLEPILGAGGEVAGLLGASINVTRRRETEAALRDREALLSSIGDHLPAGAVYQVVATPAGGRRFTYMSAGIEAITGVSAAEAMADADAINSLVFEEDRPALEAAERDSYLRRAPFVHEFRQRTRSGEVKWVQCRSAPRELPDGSLAWDGVVVDVTPQKRAEEALREADRRKDEFLAMLAHELRNPLAPVRNAVQILQVAGPSEPVLVRARETIERQVGHMARLLDDLLEVSRITRGKIRLKPEPVDLTAVLRRAVEAVMPLVKARRHDLTLTVPGLPVRLSADPTRLEQVFVNLATNAAKYTPDGGSIRVAVECRGGCAVVTVSDNGIGISRELLPRVFDLFVQAEQGSDRSQGGLGIGLTLVKTLTELHGGAVEAASEGAGRGTSFTVRLPLAPACPAAPAAETRAAVAAPARRILVVDDNRDGAESLATLLQLSGHNVEVANDGPAALAAAARFRPEVVLLDIGLPGMDGYAVARELRAAPGGARAVLVATTGYGQEEDVRRALDSGFDYHLVKPVDPGSILALIASAL